MNSIDNNIDLCVILPAYKDFNKLQSSLSGLSRQKDIKLEIIIVADYSDRTDSADLEKWRPSFPSLKFFKMPEKSGAFLCRLKGLELAAAPYIAFMDAELKLYDDQAYARALKAPGEKHFDIIHFNTLVKNKWGLYSLQESLAPISQGPLYGKEIFSDWIKSDSSPHAIWNKFYSLDLCRRVASLDHGIKIDKLEDLYLSISFFLLAQSYLPVGELVYKYQLSPEDSLESSTIKALDALRLYLEMPALLAGRSRDAESMDAFKNVMRKLITIYGSKICEFLTDNEDHSLDMEKLRHILRLGSEKEIFMALAIANGGNAIKLKDISKILRHSW